MSTGDIANNPDRERLRQHFQTGNTPSRWDELWSRGTFLPWDRGTPNPALIDVLSKEHGFTQQDSNQTNQPPFLGPPVTEQNGKKRRKKALVPGCGKGYDVFLFAAFGYDAYGVEGSANAIKACEGFREEAEGREEYKVRDERVGRGEFLCALEPKSRPAWSQRMYDLLHPKGSLICLEFPTYKEPSTGGPPWALPPEVYENLLPYPGEELTYNADGYVIEKRKEPNNKSMVRVAHWQPDRTHEIGKGTDWIGIWQHRANSPRIP
ncbi:hypothetical protein FKW77_009658 [Venturia effusa]|uniref:S-adenosyl-L-methionine-dependent methyltransferase n=1 Tax=Venturia effusa TaxID=50376 RepID=A0A517L684_9PEZI|nr:hypothetical protein FKW77_009658 [Venturia effusa]